MKRKRRENKIVEVSIGGRAGRIEGKIEGNYPFLLFRLTTHNKVKFTIRYTP